MVAVPRNNRRILTPERISFALKTQIPGYATLMENRPNGTVDISPAGVGSAKRLEIGERAFSYPGQAFKEEDRIIRDAMDAMGFVSLVDYLLDVIDAAVERAA